MLHQENQYYIMNDMASVMHARRHTYAAVVYLRTLYNDGETPTTRIVAAKNCVIPL